MLEGAINLCVFNQWFICEVGPTSLALLHFFCRYVNVLDWYGRVSLFNNDATCELRFDREVGAAGSSTGMLEEIRYGTAVAKRGTILFNQAQVWPLRRRWMPLHNAPVLCNKHTPARVCLCATLYSFSCLFTGGAFAALVLSSIPRCRGSLGTSIRWRWAAS